VIRAIIFAAVLVLLSAPALAFVIINRFN